MPCCSSDQNVVCWIVGVGGMALALVPVPPSPLVPVPPSPPPFAEIEDIILVQWIATNTKPVVAVAVSEEKEYQNHFCYHEEKQRVTRIQSPSSP